VAISAQGLAREGRRRPLARTRSSWRTATTQSGLRPASLDRQRKQRHRASIYILHMLLMLGRGIFLTDGLQANNRLPKPPPALARRGCGRGSQVQRRNGVAAQYWHGRIPQSLRIGTRRRRTVSWTRSARLLSGSGARKPRSGWGTMGAPVTAPPKPIANSRLDAPSTVQIPYAVADPPRSAVRTRSASTMART
jgi:hypothetical protein